MSWPLGYCKRSVRIHATDDGVIHASGRTASEPGGWIDLTMPPAALARGAPAELSVRVRVSLDDDGEPYLFAEQIEVQGRRYQGVYALIVNEGAAWVGAIAGAVHAHIVRVAGANATPSGASDLARAKTISLRAVRPVVKAPTPDDTWQSPAITATRAVVKDSGATEASTDKGTGDRLRTG